MNSEVYKCNSSIVLREEDDEALLFNPDNSDIVVLNSTGRFIWAYCDGKNTKKEILDKMLEEFSVSAEEAEKDLDSFLASLLEKDFIRARKG
jgi:methyltransferase-like protein